MAINPHNPKPLKRIIKRNTKKTKATDHERVIVPSWTASSRAARTAPKPPAGESWWLEPANLGREAFQAEGRRRHPDKLGIVLKPYP